jgi:hypothetical protein
VTIKDFYEFCCHTGIDDRPSGNGVTFKIAVWPPEKA